MRYFNTANLAVLFSILTPFASAHPSFFDSRALPQTDVIPINDLLVESKVEFNGTGSGETLRVVMPATDKREPHVMEFDKRTPIGNPCANDPCCRALGINKFQDVYRWRTSTWSQSLGAVRRISEPICPPGSVTNSRTISYQASINVQLGPDLKFGPSILDKFGIRVGFAYTWGTATTVGYTAACSDGGEYPCFAIFTPRIGKINGIGWIEHVGGDGTTICSKTKESQMEISVPIVDSEECKGGDRNPCGPSGVYDHCYAVGAAEAKSLCPRSKIDLKHPPKRVCPAGVTGQP